MRVMDYADTRDDFPLDIYPDDPVIRAVNRWVERTAFPEKEYLFRTYARPGRWQRPLEEDVAP
jgi:hypothetical protein